MSSAGPLSALPSLPSLSAEGAPGEVPLPLIVVDTSEKQPVQMLTGRNGACIRLSPSAAELLRLVERGASFDEVAARVSARSERPVTAADVEGAYRKLVERIAVIEGREVKPGGLFWLRRPILPKRVVEPLAKRLSLAFHPLLAAAFALFIAAGAVMTLKAGFTAGADHFWYGYALFLASLAAHELGHAGACARYGATPGDIGFVMYFIYPSFYSDSTAAWALKRWQRVVVDLGGVYFQLIAGALFSALLWATGWEPLRTALVFIAGSCLLSLNPILKFDGYWVVSDALGVTNLGRQPQRMVENVLDRLRGRRPRPLPWPAPVAWALILYTLVTFGFWGFFLWRVAPALGGRLVLTASELIDFVSHLRAQPAWPDRKLLGNALTSTYILLFLLMLLSRAARAVIDAIRRRAARPSAPEGP